MQMSLRLAGLAFLASASLIAVSGAPAFASEPAPPVIEAVEGYPPVPEEADDLEIETEWRMFANAGFEILEFKDVESERDNVFRNLLAPDYRGRKGEDAPADAKFDFLLKNVTGGKYNDVVVSSQMPGDCDERGCMTIVFRMKEDKSGWDVVGRFQAMEVGYRWLGNGASEFAAIGDDVSPSVVYRWDGNGYAEVR